MTGAGILIFTSSILCLAGFYLQQVGTEFSFGFHGIYTGLFLLEALVLDYCLVNMKALRKRKKQSSAANSDRRSGACSSNPKLHCEVLTTPGGAVIEIT